MLYHYFLNEVIRTLVKCKVSQFCSVLCNAGKIEAVYKTRAETASAMTIQAVMFIMFIIFIFIIRGMLETLSLIHCVKLLHPFSKYARDQQVSAYNRSFLTIFRIRGCKEILFCLLHAKKITLAVLLYVFIIGFPASLLRLK